MVIIEKKKIESILEDSSSNVSFYHFIEYDLDESLDKPSLSNNSPFHAIEKDRSIGQYIEGFSLLMQENNLIERGKKGLSKWIYEELHVKYNIHVKSKKGHRNSLCFDILEDNIYIKLEVKSNIGFNINIEQNNKPSNSSNNVTDDWVKKIFDFINDSEIKLNPTHFQNVDYDIKQLTKILKGKIKNSEEINNDKFINLFKVLCYFLFPTKDHPQKYFSAFVPGTYSIKDKTYGQKEISSSGLVVLFNKEKDCEFISDFATKVFKWASKKTITKLKQIVFNHSRKSAKSAIMSRNMSHNLGSHVLAYIRHKLLDVQTIIKENSLKNLLPATTDDILNNDNKANLEELIDHLQAVIKSDKNGASIPFDIAKADEIELPFLIGLGHLINYLQERQDFIATISTNHIPYSVPVNFKDTIYDELNHDYKAIRHKDSQAYRYKGDNLLLDNIARSESFERRDITISFRKFSGLNNQADIIENKDDRYDHKDVENDFNRFNEINVSLPGGAIGRQAFFSIIENFIRNTAKHSGRESNDKKLEIKMDLIDLDKEDEKNKSVLNTYVKSPSKEENEEEISKGKIQTDNKMSGYYRVEICDNQRNFDDAQTILNIALNDDYIEEDGSLKEEYKGIKEMRISATWLRFIDDEKILEGENYPPVLQLANKGGNICYVFYLLKPKDLLFVTDNQHLLKKYEGSIGSEAWKHAFNKNGWKITSFDDLDPVNDSQYRLIVFDEYDKNSESIIKKKSKCHARQLQVKDLSNELKENIDNGQDKDTVFNHFYESLIKTNLNKNELPKIQVIESDKKKLQKQDPTYENKITICNGFVQDKEKNVIVYKDHFDTLANYKKFKKNLPNTSFVESVSGNNSSDRLIRKTNFDKRWYLNMAESALTSVVVIDERLWSYFSEIKEDELTNTKNLVSFVNIYKKRFKGRELKDKIKECSDRKNAGLTEREITMRFDKGANLQEMENNNQTKIKKLITPAYNDHNYNILKHKNVQVFNILISSEEFKIIEINAKGRYSIEKLNSGLNIQPINIQPSNNGSKIDFISIHQGLVDKIYGKFFGDSDPREKSAFKGIILDEIKEILNAKNIVVHSGRSRPSKSDLPERFAFLQYSAISHAIKDCKHSLTELLYSARYE